MTTHDRQLMAMLAGIASAFQPSRPRGALGIKPDNPLTLRRCDPSRHNSLRYDQIERRRKRLRKQARCS